MAPGLGRACALALCLACLAQGSAGLDWRDRLLAAESDTRQQPDALTLLLRELDSSHRCNDTSDCCAEDPGICECHMDTCLCDRTAYWQQEANACVRKGKLNQNCTRGEDSCFPLHSNCQFVDTRGYRCECMYPYRPDSEGTSCIRAQSPFFTTTIIVSICILFAAVAIGVVMQIRNNMQRRQFQQHYRRHADLDALLAAQRRARQRRAAQRRANPTRRYSEEAAPDEPPPPYVPIFTTRSSGDWGKLPSYQEATASAPERDNEAFEMEEGVSTEAEAVPPVGGSLEPGAPVTAAGGSPAGSEDRRQPAPGVSSVQAAPAGGPGLAARLTSPAARGPESPLRRTGSF